MSSAAVKSSLSLILSVLCVGLLPTAGLAQQQWTGIGAIGGTAMFMDTTTIVRSGPLREVWIKSLDSTPKQFVVEHDTLTFDSVIGLNVFDCAGKTRTVTTVQYLLGDEIVFNVPETHGKPEPLRPKSFFEAIYNDLCRSPL
ncbi:MAG TPA: surface-adhesin E family protein [Gemmatimonadaceae bacterium]